MDVLWPFITQNGNSQMRFPHKKFMRATTKTGSFSYRGDQNTTQLYGDCHKLNKTILRIRIPIKPTSISWYFVRGSMRVHLSTNIPSCQVPPAPEWGILAKKGGGWPGWPSQIPLKTNPQS